MGDTRLGGDASNMARLTRTALNGLYNNDTNVSNSNTNSEQGADTRPTAGQSTEQPRLRVGLTYDAAGSHETANDLWRGGVVLGSLGAANKRLEGRIDDCRGWGRYVGRVYRGASKKTMVFIETYFPDATYELDNVAREDYSQMLGSSAAAALPGVSATRWKRGAAPPKPKMVQTKRPKRLLIDDLTMHLRPCAYDANCTIVIMGDLNTDLISRTGYDNRALQTMIDDLGLVSCADARWPASSCVFKTHKATRRTLRPTLTTSSSQSAMRARCEGSASMLIAISWSTSIMQSCSRTSTCAKYWGLSVPRLGRRCLPGASPRFATVTSRVWLSSANSLTSSIRSGACTNE